MKVSDAKFDYKCSGCAISFIFIHGDKVHLLKLSSLYKVAPQK